jgi:poly(A) polymerase
MTLFSSGFHPLNQEANLLVLELSKQQGVKAYLVGGYLRDAISGRYGKSAPPRDFDYAVAGGSAIALAEYVAAQTQGHYVLLDRNLDTARVVLDSGVILDFAGCVGGKIETDVFRRDFTVNALAWDSDNPEAVIDLVNGLADVQTRTIRGIEESNFVDDPLRLLRAFRFASTFGGKIAEPTYSMIQRNSKLLSRVAAERVSYELFLTMEGPEVSGLVKAMGECGLLEEIFPELSETRRVTKNAFHHLGLWDHSLELVAQAEARLPGLPAWAQDSCAQELGSGISRLSATKVACILHDVGKPDTWSITAEGRHTFYGHDRVGAQMVELIADRLRWSKPVSRFIVNLVRWHLRPGQLFHQGPPTDRAVHRFYRAMHNEMAELMLLAFADLGATCGPGIEGDKHDSLETSLTNLLQEFPNFIEQERLRIRWLDGNQVMQLLHIQPTPVVGEILQALGEAQSLNEIGSRADAERFVLDYYAQRQSSERS